MRKYLVTADHVAERHACKDRLFICSEYSDTGLWYAKAQGYGCSKNYTTPERAIQGMLRDHACTNIRIVEA